MANFPSLCPTSRSYTTGDFPTKRFQSISGAGTTRLYGSKAFNATLELEFVVDQSQLQSLLTCWSDSRGSYDSLTIAPTNKVFDGMDESVFPSYLEWRWAEAPSVSSVMPQLSRVTVKLIATLEA